MFEIVEGVPCVEILEGLPCVRNCRRFTVCLKL